MSAYNFGGSGRNGNLTKLARGCGSSWGDNMDTNFATGAPYKMWEENIQNSARFLTTFDFDLESFSGTDRHIENSKVLDQLHFIPCWVKKFGELWSTNKKVIGAHIRLFAQCPQHLSTQVDFFQETAFKPLQGVTPSNVYTPDNPLNCISSRTMGTGR